MFIFKNIFGLDFVFVIFFCPLIVFLLPLLLQIGVSKFTYCALRTYPWDVHVPTQVKMSISLLQRVAVFTS